MKITREELTEMGCEERKSRRYGSLLYFKDDKLAAKECTKCKEIVTIIGFNKAKKNLDGHASQCRKCQNERSRAYRNANLEKERERFRQYRDANLEKCRDLNRKYREENPEKVFENNRKHREENREKLRYHAREYRKLFPEKNRESRRKYRDNNPEIVRESSRKWHAANPSCGLLKETRRRARKASLPDTLTLEQRTNVLIHFNGGCALTGSTDYHLDHVIPLSIGHGGTTYGNMIPLRSDLNSSKCDRNIFEWFENNYERLALSQTKFNTLIDYLSEINDMTTREYREYVEWCFNNPIEISENKQVPSYN